MIHKKLDVIRDENGALPHWAWPGGYPIVYIAKDGESVCPTCANDPKLFSDPELDDAQWTIILYDIHWEGPPLICCHCNAMIASAYGDPDEEVPV